MSEQNYEPNGIKFFDKKSDREMILILDGPYVGWIGYKHQNGQWVTLRKATDEDTFAIDNAVQRHITTI